MKLNHLNLTVTDVAAARAFLETYFELKTVHTNKHMAFLSDDNGLLLGLTSMAMNQESDVRYPASFHIGFMQDSDAAVNAINQRLKADGFEIPPPARMHGSWTFYVQAPGGFTLEVQTAP